MKEQNKRKIYEMKCLEGYHPRILVNESFVRKNKLTLNRSQKEIYSKIKEEGNIFGRFAMEVLVDYLKWEKAKEFFKDEFIEEVELGKKPKPRVITDVYEAAQDMLDYLIFGYSKALDERGLSAVRTIKKLKFWLWLLGREDLEKLIDDDSLYCPYGIPALIALTEKLGLPVPDDLLAKKSFGN